VLCFDLIFPAFGTRFSRLKTLLLSYSTMSTLRPVFPCPRNRFLMLSHSLPPPLHWRLATYSEDRLFSVLPSPHPLRPRCLQKFAAISSIYRPSMCQSDKAVLLPEFQWPGNDTLPSPPVAAVLPSFIFFLHWTLLTCLPRCTVSSST